MKGTAGLVLAIELRHLTHIPEQTTIDMPLSNSLLIFPNELLIDIGDYLDKNDVYALFRTNRRLSFLLKPRLLWFACSKEHSVTALYLAAADGDEAMIRLILNKGHPMFTKTPRVRRISLTKDGIEATVRRLLDQGSQSIILGDTGLTALHKAVRSRNIPLVKLLLSKGANPYITSPQSTASIHQAIDNSDEAMVRLLVENGVNINGPTEWRSSVPLRYAVLRSIKNMIKLLVELGADVDGDWSDDGYGPSLLTCFLWFCTGTLKSLEVAELLLQLGANPNARNGFNRTALDIASSRSDKLMCALLESYGAVRT